MSYLAFIRKLTREKSFNFFSVKKTNGIPLAPISIWFLIILLCEETFLVLNSVHATKNHLRLIQRFIFSRLMPWTDLFILEEFEWRMMVQPNNGEGLISIISRNVRGGIRDQFVGPCSVHLEKYSLGCSFPRVPRDNGDQTFAVVRLHHHSPFKLLKNEQVCSWHQSRKDESLDQSEMVLGCMNRIQHQECFFAQEDDQESDWNRGGRCSSALCLPGLRTKVKNNAVSKRQQSHCSRRYITC